jgi:putative heme uptake system protein
VIIRFDDEGRRSREERQAGGTRRTRRRRAVRVDVVSPSPAPSPADLAHATGPVTLAGGSHPDDVAADVPAPPARTLLVWDAPNMDMSLGSLLGARPTSAFRPRFDAVGRWLLGLAGPEGLAEATVFTNVVPGSTEIVRPWVEALRNVGFAVFAKPKTAEDSDVDDDMLAHIEARHAEGGLEHVVVASGDGRAFREPLEALVEQGVRVTVIGFREYAAFAVASEVVAFLDLEEIEGVFREPLPRVSLDTLPAGGAWLQPLRSLRSLLDR